MLIIEEYNIINIAAAHRLAVHRYVNRMILFHSVYCDAAVIILSTLSNLCLLSITHKRNNKKCLAKDYNASLHTY